MRRLDINWVFHSAITQKPASTEIDSRRQHDAIYVLLDFHPFLTDPVNVRTLKDICQDYARCARTIVLLSHELTLPRELEHLAARFSLPFRRVPSG